MNKIFSDTKIFPLPGTQGILGDTEINGLFPASLPSHKHRAGRGTIDQTEGFTRQHQPVKRGAE